MQVDLCDTHSVSRFAKDFQARYRRLDILVNNGMTTTLKHTHVFAQHMQLLYSTECIISQCYKLALSGILASRFDKRTCSKV
jgi:NAD(P)-dependent dehydrogenase (short-subunit alcohol dehydrogenase family)